MAATAPVSHLRENPFEIAQQQLREVADTFGIDDRLVNVLQECKKSVEVSIPTPRDDGSITAFTGYRVTPVVGWVEPPFAVTPDPVEVADVFEVPLSFLLEPANQQRHFRMIGDRRRDYYAIPYGERYIWGATAAMLLILDRTLRAA